MFGIFCKENTFLSSSKASADYKNILSCKEFTVTGSTVCHSMSFVLRLTLKAYHSRMCTCCKEYTETLYLTLCCFYFLNIIIHIYGSNFCKLKFCSEVLGLNPHFLGEGMSVSNLNTRIIYHFRSNGNLAAKLFLFKHYYPVAGSCKVKSCCEPCRTSTDYSNII